MTIVHPPSMVAPKDNVGPIFTHLGIWCLPHRAAVSAAQWQLAAVAMAVKEAAVVDAGHWLSLLKKMFHPASTTGATKQLQLTP